MNIIQILSWLAEYSLQIVLLIGICLPLPRLMRIRNPEVRLFFYYGLLVSVLCLPFVPEFARPLTGAAGVSEIVIRTTYSSTANPAQIEDVLLPVLLAILISVAVGRIVMLGVGYLVLSVYRSHAREVEVLPRETDFYGVHSGICAEIRISDRVKAPLSFGWIRPTILLPEQFYKLPTDQQRAVLWHELIHLKRGDWLFVVFEQFIRALLWFHPAIRMLLGRIDLSREQVVDRQVVLLTGASDTYLRSLYSIAKAFRQTSVAPMIPFIRRGHLKQRVALLRQEVSMTNARRFFMSLFLFLVVATTALIAASTVGISTGPGLSEVVPRATSNPGFQEEEQAEPGGAITIQDETNVKIKLVKRVNPVYPEEAKKEGLTGSAVLTLKIGKDGKVIETSVKESAHELLDQAAVEAVHQWEYTPPVLDGEPVEVLATVTIAFKLN